MQNPSQTENILRTAREAGYIFLLVFSLAPIISLIFAYKFGTIDSLLALHITSGLLWFSLVIGSPVVSALEYYDKFPKMQRFALNNIPKFSFLAFTFGFIAVLSGTLLYLNPTSSGANTGIWRLIALISAWFIFLVGLFGPNRLHIAGYYERTGSNPDQERISRLNYYNLIIGGFESILIIGFVIAMNFV